MESFKIMNQLHLEKEPDEIAKELGEMSSLKEQEEYLAKNRKIFLWGGVDDKSAERLVKRLMYLDSISNDDITLFINSPGGVISSGMAIYDCMQSIASDVATVVCGQAASMGAVLLAAGANGKRYAWKHARVMIHQPLISGQMYGPASDIEIQAEEMLRIRSELNDILAFHCKKDAATIEKDTDRDHFMSAPESVKYGIIDHVQNIF
jgi:ATP-dependent Clp protease, protease subunit